MKERRLPNTIDPSRLAETHAKFAGLMSMAKMSELDNLILNRNDSFEVDIEFKKDEAGYRVMTGTLTGQVMLECQRCLSEFLYQLKGYINLAVVLNLEQAKLLPDQYEPLLQTTDSLRLDDIIQEEIILNLPLVPMHELGECPDTTYLQKKNSSITVDENMAKKQNPFEKLAELKSVK